MKLLTYSQIHCSITETSRAKRQVVMEGILSGNKGLFETNKECIWNRSVNGTEIEKIRNLVNTKYGTTLENYLDLHQWSIENNDNYWDEMWKYFGIISSTPYNQVSKPGKTIIHTEWFCGAKWNYAENLLKFCNDRTALICVDEGGNEERVTYRQMYQEVQIYAAALRKKDLQKGDVVACYMPNRKEAVFAMLAVVSIGGIWGGPVYLYGARAAANIIKAMKPKFLFTTDRFVSNQVEYNIMGNLSYIAKNYKTIDSIIIVPYEEETLSADDLLDIENSIFLKQFLDSGRNEDGTVPVLVFEQLPSNHPVFISFTSGTTGSPKGVIHGSSALLHTLVYFRCQMNFTKDDVILSWYSVGTSIWNIFISILSIGTTILLYNGWPGNKLWDLISMYNVTSLFFSTSVVDKMESDGIRRDPKCKLDCLKSIMIGASPVKLQNIHYLRQNSGKHVFISVVYASTEILGGVCGSDFNLPAFGTEIQVPVLGVDTRCIDERGGQVIGKCGELVIANALPSMPIGFWRDLDQKDVFDSNLSKYPGFWVQHDVAWINPVTKGFVIVGRSDSTINALGVRFHSTEIYNTIHEIEELQDYICVQQANIHACRQRAILFVQLKKSHSLSEDLVNKIKTQVRRELSVSHVPELVIEVPDIPYNLNNKKVETMVKKIVNTNEIPYASNIKNPECLKFYCDIPELQKY